MQQSNVPLFPLSAHLLPGGRMALRIFEPRYTRMIKEACAAGSGFVMCMLNAKGSKAHNTHIHSVGTYATIVDFDLLEDGLLGVTVAGEYAVSISHIQTEADELRVGRIEAIPPWCCNITLGDIRLLQQRLKEIFERYPELNKLHNHPQFEDPLWIIYRWLELVPIESGLKQEFLQQSDSHKVLNYLLSLVD